jgi:hypothetical protein
VRKWIVPIGLASAVALLGGCAGSGTGGSLIPSGYSRPIHQQDSMGGGPPPNPNPDPDRRRGSKVGGAPHAHTHISSSAAR